MNRYPLTRLCSSGGMVGLIVLGGVLSSLAASPAAAVDLSTPTFGDGVSRYEVAWQDEHHDHLICIECQKIVEFEDEGIEQLQHKVAERHGFELVRHKLELYGVCSDCRAHS